MSLTVKTPEDLAAAQEAAERASAAEAARRYLAETDWMAIRAAETGRPMPEDVAKARAEARKTAGG